MRGKAVERASFNHRDEPFSSKPTTHPMELYKDEAKRREAQTISTVPTKSDDLSPARKRAL